MDRIRRAMHFAIDAHGDIRRKGDGEPSILHSMEAASIVASLTQDDDVIAAAILHDVVEDTAATMEDIETKFGSRIAELVAAETEDKQRHLPPEASWLDRKKAALEVLRTTEDIGVKLIFLGDKLSNMRSFYSLKRRYGDKMWELFNQRDPEAHHIYYRTICDLLSDLSDSLAWIEYNQLIIEVFEEIPGGCNEVFH